MSKRSKKNRKRRGERREIITITVREIILSSRNPIHFEHVTNGIKGGVFGGSKRDQRRRTRREARSRDEE